MVFTCIKGEPMKNERNAQVVRQTKETDITIALQLDGSGQGEISTGIGFFDHLLDSFKRHSLINLTLTAKGDLHIDYHHTVEDVGLCLGKAFNLALADKTGIRRYGFAYCPLDEALSRTVVDISGRGYLALTVPENLHAVGLFSQELLVEFLRAFAVQSQITVHAEVLSGGNQHHMMESLIKSLARALRMAIAIDPQEHGIPSTKGMLA